MKEGGSGRILTGLKIKFGVSGKGCREEEKPLEIQICKGRSAGMSSHTAELGRGRLSSTSIHRCSALPHWLEGSMHTPPLQ